MVEAPPPKTYSAHLAHLRSALPDEAALEAAVGGEFIAMGRLECALLRSLGLASGQTVVDVGCGSGRLALPLSTLPGVRYIGTDVVPEFLEHARRISRRDDWDFIETDGTVIPCADGIADFVCFFSVFTHLPHDHTFRYLREARRVLKPGGRIVFSFLEFGIECHWEIFRDYVERARAGYHWNQFMDRAAIHAWARHTGLRVDAIEDGDKPHIPLYEALAWQDGRTFGTHGCLGQSVAVLSKPAGGE